MLKVLIADDDQLMLDCLTKFIKWQELEYELTDTVLNGSMAYDIAIEKNIDVIITDIKMPLMDGVTLCQKLRESNHNVAIIFLSAYDDFQTARFAMQYHVSDYILKPLSPDKITQLESILIKIQMERRNRNDFLTMINSPEFSEHAKKAMKENDLAFFDNFFEDIKADSGADFNTVQIACIRMLNLIYDFVYSNTTVSPASSKEASFSTLLAQNTKSTMVDYVSGIYKSVFQHAAHNTRKDYDAIIQSIKQYIGENYYQNWFGINSVATLFFFSIPHLNRIFKNATHITISEYIGNLRLEKAVELLEQTSLPVNKIAAKVGYSSDNYFIRIFKNKYKVTPTDYRRKKCAN